jgi:hypothetical protein
MQGDDQDHMQGDQGDEQDGGKEHGEQHAKGSSFEEELDHVNSKTPHKTKRTRSFTNKEDELLCDVWLHISQDPICGPE